MPDATPIYGLPQVTLTDSPVDLMSVPDLAQAVEDTLQTAVVTDATGTAGNMEIVSKSINPGNLAGHTGQDFTISGLTGLLAGDYCIFIGGGIRSQMLRTETICTVPGQVTMHQFNSDSTDVNVGPTPVYLLIIHHA